MKKIIGTILIFTSSIAVANESPRPMIAENDQSTRTVQIEEPAHGSGHAKKVVGLTLIASAVAATAGGAALIGVRAAEANLLFPCGVSFEPTSTKQCPTYHDEYLLAGVAAITIGAGLFTAGLVSYLIGAEQMTATKISAVSIAPMVAANGMTGGIGTLSLHF